MGSTSPLTKGNEEERDEFSCHLTVCINFVDLPHSERCVKAKKIKMNIHTLHYVNETFISATHTSLKKYIYIYILLKDDSL